jgi:rfaE bifunctional protein nucleotidyltransferase chain/domain
MEFSTHHDDDDSVRRELSEKVQDNEFKSLLRSYYAFQNKDRILTIEASGVVANELKKRGRVIGMCNGCFDLTHLGHVSLFEQAKSRCDVLFVAVNSDQSVKSLKGPTRPFVDFKGRLGMVASNRFVDYVVMSEKTSHLDVVDAVKPSIYIATTETSSKSPEAREILLYGGKVEVVEMLPNYNTTSIATKISRTE